ncbi:pentatricopeptide repeat-containing protein At5g19020, mitochondrial [Magnolia sinica]|uniref:pentatricopeptide repeat-containing protein At5g19020, mitochondrial n=1 Tax=Magnolia sinica TaxID=86752 RepID=UPI0026597FEA|nr:pentatricopeptide repeat-containing protein At5g19020, mitochondrial [Magnolia sinica]
MINAARATFLRSFVLLSAPSIIVRSRIRWISALLPPDPMVVIDHLHTFFHNRGQPASEFAMVSALKFCSSPSQSEQIHSLLTKSGLDSNIFIHNSLINLYTKCGHIGTARLMFDSAPFLDSASWNTMIVGYVKLGRLEDACCLFEEMPERDCISFTTMIMGFAKSGRLIEASEVFREMRVAGVVANEVTLASVIPACVNLHAMQDGRMIHGLVIKCGFERFVLVSTNLVHMYAVGSSLADAEFIFNEMPEQNIVTWNVMLNGYVKSGCVDSARELFDRIPTRDVVSWSTMIDGYIQMDMLPEALVMYREMLRAQLRPNEVTVVDLLSACSHFSTVDEGWQFHGIVLKMGLDCHVFVQATIIHFYAACQQIYLACLQFQLADKGNVSSWNALITGFIRNNMVNSARKLFDEMPERDVISWSSMIAGYVQIEQFHLALDLFHDMQVTGLRPNEITMVSVVSAIAHSGTLKLGRWIHDYICENSIPINDNLSAALIDMYAKCGNIGDALEMFHHIRDKTNSICPWNAMICGLAMHGHANESLSMFSDLQKTDIKPNSITFIGVLSACCHAGLLDVGRRYFESMKNVYSIEPNIKHYGCMVDLLGRAGCLEEAERLIESMPMKADVVIWGSMLAACRTHGNVEIGERAAESLEKLEPSHGAGRVLLSNIYAEAGRWDDVLQVRREMQSRRVKKLPGFSGVM